MQGHCAARGSRAHHSTLPSTNTSGPFKLHNHTRCHNSFSDSTTPTTVGQCEALCKATNHCEVFTFFF